MKQHITLVDFGIVVFILAACALGYMHESAHVEIYKMWGVESHIEYFSHFPDMVTIADGDASGCNDSCKIAHAANESFGYQALIIYLGIGLLFIWVLSYLDLLLMSSIYMIEQKHLNTTTTLR